MSDIDTARLRDRPTPLDAEVAIWLLTQRIDYDMNDDQGRIDSIVATLRAQADRIAELERTVAAAGRALREAQERTAVCEERREGWMRVALLMRDAVEAGERLEALDKIINSETLGVPNAAIAAKEQG